ncbi:hypothetical protein [Ligilactobacillus saerimneri]
MLANVKGKYMVNFFRKNITNVGHKNLANKKPPKKGRVLEGSHGQAGNHLFELGRELVVRFLKNTVHQC